MTWSTDIAQVLQVMCGVRGLLHPVTSLQPPDELLVGLEAGIGRPREAEELPQDDTIGPDVRLQREHPGKT